VRGEVSGLHGRGAGVVKYDADCGCAKVWMEVVIGSANLTDSECELWGRVLADPIQLYTGKSEWRSN
jgi:hypothetical protein